MTKRIKLTKGMYATVDDEDYAWLNQWKWCVRVKKHGQKYAARGMRCSCGEGRTTTVMHREILARHGETPKIIDHIDGDGLNNTKINLRGATSAQNAANRHLQKNNVSGYMGVHRSASNVNPWRAQIGRNGQIHYLGIFPTREEAARAYDIAAPKYHGEFATLNFPDRRAIQESADRDGGG